MKTSRPTKQFSVSAAPNSSYGASLRVVTDGELMTNYQPVLPVAPGQCIAAAQDLHGNPMLFSIGGDGRLYLIGQAPGTASGWTQIELSPGLGSELYALSFGLSQAADGSLCLGVALAPTADDTTQSTLYLATGLPNNPLDPAWQDMRARWVARPADDLGAPPISRILIGQVLDANTPPLVIAVAKVAGEDQHYFVNGDTGSSAWLWKDYPLPLDAATVKDLVIGACALGLGSYALSVDPSGNQTSLTFTSVPDAYGQTYNRQLQCPPGARRLAAVPDPNNYGYSQLFVGGDGLHWFPSTGQAANAAAATILAASPGGGVFELEVRENNQQIVIWWNDASENLYFVQGQQSNHADGPGWSAPLVLRSQVTQIAAYCSLARQTSAIFYVTGSSKLGFMYQANSSSLWKETSIPLTDTGAVDSFTCYTSQIQFMTEQGAPLANLPVRVSASELTYTTINGNLYVLDVDQPAMVNTDPTGALTCINRVTDIATPIYSVAAEFLAAPVVLNPADKVIGGLANIQTGDDLKQAKKQDGTPLISGDYPDEVYDYAAYSLTQLNSMLAQLPADGAPVSDTTPAAKTAPHAAAASDAVAPEAWGMLLGAGGPRLYTGAAVGRELIPALGGRAQPSASAAKLDLGAIDFVEGVFGDVMQALETGVEEVVGFFVSAAEQAFECVVKIGKTMFKVVIKCLAQALELLCWLLDELLGLDLLGFLQWLGFLFNWGDILTTHAVIANMANQSLNLVSAEAKQAERAIVVFFTELRRKLQGLPTLPDAVASLTVGTVIDTTKLNTSAEDQANAQSLTSGVVGTFTNYQLQFSGMLDTTPTGSETGTGPVLTFFEDVLVPTLKQAAGLLKTLSSDLVSVIEGVAQGTMTIGQAIGLIVNDTLIELLELCEVLAIGILDVADSLVSTLQALLDAPIEIPFLTALYKLVTGDEEMTLLNGLALLAAIPSTIFYKLVTDTAPFDDDGYGLATGDYQQVFSILGASGLTGTASATSFAATTSSEPSTAQMAYSTLGGATALGAKLVSSTLDSIDALAKNEVKFSSELKVISSLVGVGATFPVDGEGGVLDLGYGSWALSILDLLVDFCVYLTPRSLKVEMGTSVQGPYILLSTTVQLGLAITTLVLLCEQHSGEDLAWDVESFVEEVAYAAAGYGSGIAKIDPDPESEAVEEGAAILCTFVGILLGGIRDIDVMLRGDVFAP